MGFAILLIGSVSALLVASCGRGVRIPGPSWFDIAHDVNRQARRTQR